MALRLAVSGSRSLVGDAVRTRVFAALDQLHRTVGISLLVHGGARGIDTIADLWAHWRRVETLVFLPDWDGPDGRRAGIVRNVRLLGAADRLLAIWDGTSRGTAHAVGHARRVGMPTEVITIPGLPIFNEQDNLFTICHTEVEQRIQEKTPKGKTRIRTTTSRIRNLNFMAGQELRVGQKINLQQPISFSIYGAPGSATIPAVEIQEQFFTIYRPDGIQTELVDRLGNILTMSDVLRGIREPKLKWIAPDPMSRSTSYRRDSRGLFFFSGETAPADIWTKSTALLDAAHTLKLELAKKGGLKRLPTQTEIVRRYPKAVPGAFTPSGFSNVRPDDTEDLFDYATDAADFYHDKAEDYQVYERERPQMYDPELYYLRGTPDEIAEATKWVAEHPDLFPTVGEYTTIRTPEMPTIEGTGRVPTPLLRNAHDMDEDGTETADQDADTVLA